MAYISIRINHLQELLYKQERGPFRPLSFIFYLNIETKCLFDI